MAARAVRRRRSRTSATGWRPSSSSAWAIGEIANDNYREVLELTYLDQLPADAIAARLGISVENVYARRSRGLKELERILRDLRS